nr:zinc finger HIT domain-containing protein 1 [Anolis sagrei ordinatus]
MVEKKGSARSQDPSQRRILDRATRQRRLNRQLEALENDNFQDDPHANMPQLVKRLPQFDDDAETGEEFLIFGQGASVFWLGDFLVRRLVKNKYSWCLGF